MPAPSKKTLAAKTLAPLTGSAGRLLTCGDMMLGGLSDNTSGRIVFSLLLTGIVLAALASLVDWGEVVQGLERATPAFVAMAAAATLLATWCRGRRYRILLPVGEHAIDARGIRHFRLALSHQAIFAVLPSGSGDAVFPLLARQWLAQPASLAAAAVVLIRIQDLVALSILTIFGAIWIGIGSWYAIAVAVFLIASSPIVMTMSGRVTSSLISAAATILRTHSPEAIQGWIDRMRATFDHEQLRAMWSVSSIQVAIWTVLTWSLATAALAFLLLAFRIEASAGDAAIGLAVLNFAGAASIVTFAGLGFVEVGLAGVLTLLELETGNALVMAVSIRAMLLVLNVALPLSLGMIIDIVLRINRLTTRKF